VRFTEKKKQLQFGERTFCGEGEGGRRGMERVAVAAFMLLTQFLFFGMLKDWSMDRESARSCNVSTTRCHPLDNDAARHPDAIQQRPSIRWTSNIQ